MFHQVDTVFNATSSKPIPGALVQVYDASGVIAPLFADQSGTPIESVSGIANTAVTDGDGVYDFWVADGTYDLRFFVGQSLMRTIQKIALDGGWLRANNPVASGVFITGAASSTGQSSFTRFVVVADDVTQAAEFYRKTSVGLIENAVFASDVGGLETVTAKIYANGNVQNTNNSYGAISDRKLKENISDARDYADDFARLQFKRYSLRNEQSDEATQFGLIADEVAQVFPGLVEATEDLDENGSPTGETTSAIKYSIINLIAAKVVQELTVRVLALEQDVALLRVPN